MAWLERLRSGVVIPAHPLALTAERKLDERRQRALTRYYIAAGAGGVAVGVHTTQFEIHDPKCGLLRPVLEIAVAELRDPGLIRIAGICGDARQAASEAALAVDLGYHLGLVSFGALPEASISELIDHVRSIAAIIPVMGFYLQPAAGGRPLPAEFWRRLVQIENVLAVKVAPFNRYRTLDVVRAAAGSGVVLYTGNDDNIVADLLISFQGGLLGQWAVWTRKAVDLLEAIHARKRDAIELLHVGQKLTVANAAIFDAANNFRGCVPGIHEILRRQGLLAGRWCLNPEEVLSSGQSQEIDRVLNDYPELTDDAFVLENLDQWLA